MLPPRPLGRALPPLGERPRASYGKALRWALLASAVFHAAVLLLTGEFRFDTLPEPVATADSFGGLEWVVPVPEGAEGDSPPAEAPPEAREEPVRPVPSVLRVRPGEAQPEEPSAPSAREGAAGGVGSAREALRPGYRDPRLYVDPRALGVRGEEKSAHEKYMEHLQARIDAVNDSMGAVAARERAAKDWTFRDKEGRRWGISDEGLHLGGLTVPKELVPVPRATGDNQSLEAAREEQRQRDEIRRQEETRERRDTLEQRTRATRARKSGGGSGGG
jgi:hypothetical protein